MGNSIPIKFQDEGILKFDNADRDAVDEWRQYRRDLPPGAAHWIPGVDREHAALDFTCPCGCSTVHCVSVCEVQKADRSWLWDGNIEAPTLTPSIRCLSPCRWHGYLTKGVFVPC